MQLCSWTEPQQGASYDDLLRVARETETAGLHGFFRSDHYLFVPGAPGAGAPGSSDAWTTLAGLARETSSIRLGTLLSPATFRLPGSLAVTVATVDRMSGGRVELGLAAGWFEAEHLAFGLPFPPAPARFDAFEEQLAILRGLWSTPADETFSFDGRHYRLADCPMLPRPVQTPGPPIIMGGTGRMRTPRLAARYADEFNMVYMDVPEFRKRARTIHGACEDTGRDPASLRLSIGLPLAVGSTRREAQRRAARLHKPHRALSGTPEQVAETLLAFREAGAERAYLQLFHYDEIDQLSLVGAEVLPLVR